MRKDHLPRRCHLSIGCLLLATITTKLATKDVSQLVAPPQSSAGQEADKRTILMVFAGLIVSMFLSALDQTVFSTALPTIVGELDGVNHMLWVTTGYLVAVTIMSTLR